MRKAPKGETKKERFKRLATSRTNEVIRRLRVLGNCANHQLYEYSQDDVDKIFKAIDKKLRETKTAFRFSKKNEFKL